MKQSRRTRSAGFTLLEMLMIVVVLVVLVALVIPPIHITRERGDRIQCTNNLKQLHLSMNLYVDDIEAAGGEARYPVALGELVYKPDGAPSRYMIAPQMLICKTDTSGRMVATKAPIGRGNCSYALNAEAKPADTNAQTVVLCDKNGAGRLTVGDTNGFGGNHGGDGGTVLLASGAALFYTPEVWTSRVTTFVEIDR